MYQLQDLTHLAAQNSVKIDHEWVPARPYNYQFRSLRERLRDAWAVFTGTADAVKWPEGQ
jgi:hypothetical protein